MVGNDWYDSEEANILKAKMPESIFEAHRHTISHKLEILNSEYCGCFSCLKIFSPSEINEWITDGGGDIFSMCPFCKFDCVIGEKSGYPINEKFLREMNMYWYDNSITPISE